ASGALRSDSDIPNLPPALWSGRSVLSRSQQNGRQRRQSHHGARRHALVRAAIGVDLAEIAHAGTAIVEAVAVEDFAPGAALRQWQLVTVAGDAGEIGDHGDRWIAVAAAAQPGE